MNILARATKTRSLKPQLTPPNKTLPVWRSSGRNVSRLQEGSGFNPPESAVRLQVSLSTASQPRSLVKSSRRMQVCFSKRISPCLALARQNNLFPNMLYVVQKNPPANQINTIPANQMMVLLSDALAPNLVRSKAENIFSSERRLLFTFRLIF